MCCSTASGVTRWWSSTCFLLFFFWQECTNTVPGIKEHCTFVKISTLYINDKCALTRYHYIHTHTHTYTHIHTHTHTHTHTHIQALGGKPSDASAKVISSPVHLSAESLREVCACVVLCVCILSCFFCVLCVYVLYIVFRPPSGMFCVCVCVVIQEQYCILCVSIVHCMYIVPCEWVYCTLCRACVCCLPAAGLVYIKYEKRTRFKKYMY